MQLRQDLETKRERFGGAAASKPPQDEEDEFDAMFEEEMNAQEAKQIGVRQVEEESAKVEKEEPVPEAEIPGGKTLDQMEEEVP